MLATVVAQQGDTLLVQRANKPWTGYGRMSRADADTERVALNAVRRLDVWQGRSHLRGALKGFLIGTGTGLILGGAIAYADRECCDGMSVLAIPTFGVGGAVVGTLFGAAVGSARWRRVRP
jgi:hypothetical protein